MGGRSQVGEGQGDNSCLSVKNCNDLYTCSLYLRLACDFVHVNKLRTVSTLNVTLYACMG